MKKAVMIIVLAVVMLISGCVKKDTAPAGSTSVTWGDCTVLCREGESFAFFSGSYNGEITLTNLEDTDMTVYLYTAGDSRSVSAGAGETVSVPAMAGEVSGVRYTLGDLDESYATDENGLRGLVSDGAPKIKLLCDISLEGDLEIPHGAEINCGENTLSLSGKLIYKTDKGEKLTLSGNINAAGFEADAPLGEAEIPASLVPEYPQYTLRLAAVNGNSLEAGLHRVTSMEELKALAAGSVYKDIVLSSFAVTEEVTLADFESVTLEEFDGGGLLTLKSGGNITVKGDFEADSIKVEAEELTVDRPVEIESAKLLYRVKKYCGADLGAYTLGGDCEYTITSAALSSEGKMMTADMEWTSDGFVLYGKYSGVCAPEALRDCKIDFECEGTVTPDAASRGETGGFDLLSPLGCYVNVTDGEGKTSKYKIETEILASLPVVVIETDGKEIKREEYTSASVSLECNFAYGYESMAETEVQIKGRGNSTWKWSDKKPYKLRYESDVSLLGLRAGQDWVLLANYNDKTLFRNYLALEMAKFMDNMDCYATQIPVDVFMDGEYIGVYTLGEEIEEGDGRIEVKTDAASLDTGYLLELGGSDDSSARNVFSTDLMICVEILSPDGDTLGDEEIDYIYNYVSKADYAVKTEHGYENYIDVDSLIDWLIITELSFNSDGAMRRSVFLKKDAGGKLEMAAMWDFDIAFGNSNTDFLNYHEWATLATRYEYVRDNWICYLMKDEAFVARLRERWNEIKEPLYQFTCDRIDYAYGITKVSAEENFKVWDILWYPVGIEPYYIGWYNTYEEQVEFLRKFIDHRFAFLEEELNGGAK